MRRILQAVAIICGAYALMLQLPFADSLENTPADIMRAEVRTLERTHPFTQEQSAALERAVKQAYDKSVAERYDHYLRERTTGQFMLVLAVVAFIGARYKEPNQPPQSTR